MAESSARQTGLDQLAPGQVGFVLWIRGGRGLVSRLATLGFTPGAAVQMIQNYRHGPLIVMIRDTRVALGRGEAAHIVVSTGQ